ncbi:methionine synthase [Spirochaeta thermophila DSM 6578]|uniref:Methionine synthase n=1 Tax=Winmispira thermophila (strain ATCC 700085 / DSM 6578 / Z-1203) TaxID=869211 RepID=G0GCR7_WINT7|nr:methionine synthase [Spirochaeta thermophila]AEJ60486.1 methionine synthase [Spirochaeta thermophila DSM 6578]
MAHPIEELLKERILILDGAMGTMIQRYHFSEADYRGVLFEKGPTVDGREVALKGNHDLLALTRPHVIEEIHRAYLEAGADIIETNTFNATRVSQREYGTEDLVERINLEAARLARRVADEYSARTPHRPRFVAGVLGPTSKTLSLSPRADDPAFRELSFGELEEDYFGAVRALVEGGADLILIETVFDTLNAKAALAAVARFCRESGRAVPVMLSATISDAAGRLLSGQTPRAFLHSVLHGRPLSVGFNCAFGPEMMRPHLKAIQDAPCAVSVHPNAGLPNALGEYDQGPDQMAATLALYAREGLLNIAGGCCGTTPDHIRAIAEALEGIPPRPIPSPRPVAVFTGLEVLDQEEAGFILVGERTNVAGSARFRRLLREERWEEALEVARAQISAGAQMIDVNVDDPLLDPPRFMRRFLSLAASDPTVARVPVMIDSSDWEVLRAGLESLQGKGVVNSLSLKDGEEVFLERARVVREMGAAVLVMCFDEEGQAETFERKIAVAQRAYRLLVEEVGIPPWEIVIDPNIFAIGTGMEEHARYGLDYLEAVRWIKEHLPHARTSGGISNVSFAFRGHEGLRDAIHAVFLHHARAAGLDMAIVNPQRMMAYEEVPEEVRGLIEDLVFDRRRDATERLLEAARGFSGAGPRVRGEDRAWRDLPVEERLAYALKEGIQAYLVEDLEEAHRKAGSALGVIEGPLLTGMEEVGRLFGEGRLFLPQVVRAARVMREAVAILEPRLKAEQGGVGKARGVVVLATVKGDVHDIGKNIVKVVLECNGYRVVDLGVMVPPERVVEAARQGADAVGLSGLITPSLERMRETAEAIDRAGPAVPLLIGGAATSRLHTALRIAPAYRGPVIHVRDASEAVQVMGRLLSEGREEFVREVRAEQARLREQGVKGRGGVPGLGEARRRRLRPGPASPVEPRVRGPQVVRMGVAEVRPYLDWRMFYKGWGLPARTPERMREAERAEAVRLREEAEGVLARMEGRVRIEGVVGFFPARDVGEDCIGVLGWGGEGVIRRLPMLRQQAVKEGEPTRSLVDFLPHEGHDYLGLFVITAGKDIERFLAEEGPGEPYRELMVRLLADRLAEAASEYLHMLVRTTLWGYAPEEHLSPEEVLAGRYRGIRPAPGHAACPDHSLKQDIFELLGAEARLEVRLTESFMMVPPSSVAGFYFSHPESRYFAVGRITEEQLRDYARRRERPVDEVRGWLDHIVVADS